MSNLHTLDIKIENNISKRKERLEEIDYLVVPAIILVEGVHNNLFYSSEELQKFVKAWNGIPVPVKHPEDADGNPIPANDPNVIENSVVGKFFNAFFEDNKLKGEIWLDVNKTKKIAPEVLDIINTGKILEISTGLFLETVDESGMWNKEEYVGIATGFRPEHIALLPGSVGACSVNDGCGIRDNEEKGGGLSLTEEELQEMLNNSKSLNKNIKSKGFIKNIFDKFNCFKGNEMSHDEIRCKLQNIITGMDIQVAEGQSIMSGKYHFVIDVFDNYFIYEVYEESNGDDLFKQNFNINDDEISLHGEPIQVKIKTEYIALSESGNEESKSTIYEEVNKNSDTNEKSIENNKEEENMCCEKIVESLIANEGTNFTNNDKEWLMKMEEDQLNAMFPKKKEVKEEVVIDNKEEKTEVVVKKEDIKEEVVISNKEEIGIEDYIANAPEGIQDMLKSGLKLHEKKRADLVNIIVANKNNKLSKEQLENMDTDMLESIAALAKEEKKDFSANSGEVDTHKKEVKVNERTEDGYGVPLPPKMKWNQNMVPDYTGLN